MCLVKSSEIEETKLFSKILIWSGKLSDNKYNIFLLFLFKLLFYSQKHVFDYVFGYLIFHRLKLK